MKPPFKIGQQANVRTLRHRVHFVRYPDGSRTSLMPLEEAKFYATVFGGTMGRAPDAPPGLRERAARLSQRLRRLLLLALATVVVSACAAPIPPHPRVGESVEAQGWSEAPPRRASSGAAGNALLGAVLGAAGGAAVGSLSGDAGRGALIGSLSGAGAGLLLGGAAQRRADPWQTHPSPGWHQNQGWHHSSQGWAPPAPPGWGGRADPRFVADPNWRGSGRW